MRGLGRAGRQQPDAPGAGIADGFVISDVFVSRQAAPARGPAGSRMLRVPADIAANRSRDGRRSPTDKPIPAPGSSRAGSR